MKNSVFVRTRNSVIFLNCKFGHNSYEKFDVSSEEKFGHMKFGYSSNEEFGLCSNEAFGHIFELAVTIRMRNSMSIRRRNSVI